ncbi:NAD-dependent epimerase/dehydratase family protein [Stenotrophomonas sp.]|uniref:NAD-dependent epimerase/dehydratase family protein n=1 Tax=Stenotrophomonas sp. TaxID=69392 RepID=UPI0028AECD91|nr:NAD-dependent epimerase/dehydratase family protein [Stenotrophomonas sp.]
MAGKRVLVTGASGFTGRYMVRELERRGHTVVSLVSAAQSTADTEDDPQVRRADLRDLRTLTQVMDEVRPDHVIHLAALAFVAHGKVDDFYQINLVGTRNLFQALQDAGHIPVSVLLASSANVYGNTTEGAISEAVPPNPANDYAVSKLAMEYVARLWSDRYPLVVARPFNYTGVGQDEKYLIPKVVSHFVKGANEIELGNIDVWRDFGDVRAVVDAYARLMVEPKAASMIVNVCSGEAHSLRGIIDTCQRITGHEIAIRVNPAFVRANEVRVLRGNNELLKSVIGDWNCPDISQTLEWMLTSHLG